MSALSSPNALFPSHALLYAWLALDIVLRHGLVHSLRDLCVALFLLFFWRALLAAYARCAEADICGAAVSGDVVNEERGL